MPDVAHDQDPQSVEARDPELIGRGALAFGQDLAHGETVDQRLGRVLVPAVARVDDTGPFHPARHLMGCTRRTVANDDSVDAERLDGLDRVAQALTLLDGRTCHREREHIGRQSLGGRLEREPGPRRLFEEERRHDLATQCGHLGHGAPLHLGEGLSDAQDLGDPLRSEVRDGQYVLGGGRPGLTLGHLGSAGGGRHFSSKVPIHTPSSPTSIISSRRVGRFFPT